MRIGFFLCALSVCAPAFGQPFQHVGGISVTPTAGNCYDRSFTTNGGVVTVVPQNGARISVTYYVPSAAAPLYVEWSLNPTTGNAVNASTSSIPFVAGTIATFDASVTGYNQITAYSASTGVSVPFKECQ